MFGFTSSSTARAAALLALTTFIWGTTFVVTKNALVGSSPAVVVFGRFLIAAIVFLPWVRFDLKLWIGGVELGVMMWLGFALQTVGLTSTTVGRSAFITSLHVVFVPMLAVLWGHAPKPLIWASAMVALGGVGLLCYDGGSPNLGDLWTLLCAMAWAVYITRLAYWTRRFSAGPLTAAQLWIVTLLSAVWWIQSTSTHGPIPWGAIVYLALAATALTTWLQTIGQKQVPAPQAAVLFTMEPVWASLFGWWFLNETLGLRGMIGAILIVSAAVISQRPWRQWSRRGRWGGSDAG